MITTQWFFGTEQLEDVHQIRRAVFMEEQGVSEEEEMDGTDGACIHLVLYDGSVPAATGRIMITRDDFIIGRVAVMPAYRRKHMGTRVMQSLIHACYTMGGEVQTLHAQLTARPFYESLGFVGEGDVYEEANIPHITMRHTGDCAITCKVCNGALRSATQDACKGAPNPL